MRKKFIVDIDDTLITTEVIKCGVCDRNTYYTAKPIDVWIDRVNELYNEGHHITLWTGRGWDCEEITKAQLREFGVKYHTLVLGKPLGIYVDKDAINTLKDFC